MSQHVNCGKSTNLELCTTAAMILLLASGNIGMHHERIHVQQGDLHVEATQCCCLHPLVASSQHLPCVVQQQQQHLPQSVAAVAGATPSVCMCSAVITLAATKALELQLV